MANSTPGDIVPPGMGNHLTRNDFPEDFLFGVATSAYQVEGAYDENRRGMSNWDTWSLMRPAKVSDGGNGCVAIDDYNRIKGDIKLMKKLGINHYRFSIAWSRILPGGKLSTGVNTEGLRFYNEVIDLLLAEGIQPLVTIFHFDIPQLLEDEYSGFLDGGIVTARGVDHTIYGTWDPATEPYLVAHNLILAHAHAVDIYRTKYQAVQGGQIGMVNVTSWFFPYSERQEDIDAAQRALDFSWGWFVEPIVKGHYPITMQERVGDRLPKFNDKEKKLVTGSFDFIGMNYYTSNWAAYKPKKRGDPTNYYTDQEVQFYTERDGVPIGPQAGSDWLFSVPLGLYKLLTYTQITYNDPIIFITENGWSEKNITNQPLAGLLKDHGRIKYLQEHIAYLKLAMDMDNVKVMGYTVWAAFDNYEWAAGYTVRFGMYYVDYFNNYTRYPKSSAKWFMNFLNKKNMPLGSKARVLQIEEVMKEDMAATKRRRNN